MALSVEFNISKSCATKLSQISKDNGYSDKIIFNIFPKKESSKKLRANIVSSQAKNFHSDQHSTTFEISSRPLGLPKKGHQPVLCFASMPKTCPKKGHHPAEKAWNEANTPKNRRPPGAKRTIPAVMDGFVGD